jgi:hypothetical protein
MGLPLVSADGRKENSTEENEFKPKWADEAGREPGGVGRTQQETSGVTTHG